MANEKHIFIGIGGQGCKTIAQIKEKVYEKRFPEATKSKSRLQAMNDTYRFLFLDTDQRDIDEANKRNRATFEQGKVPFISPQTDLINLGKANPHAIYYEAKQDPNNLINKRILEACSSELFSKIPDQPLSFGAGAFRIKSRISFAHALADFQTKLQAAISSLNDVKTVGGEDCIIYYWLVSSSLGGTGSGIFNDVLYHINQLHHQIVGNGDPQLVYTMYMPKVFIDCNATEEKYSLNAFGVFSELEAFKVMSYDKKRNTVMHRLAFNNDYNLVDENKRYCPFYYLIPVDIQTDKGTSLGDPHTMIRNTAEMLYHLHNGQAGATFRSDIDNYMNDIMERNHKEFLVPMGYVSLQKPQEYFNKYMRFRLRKEILENWLLCATGKEAKVEESKIDGLVAELFRELDAKIPDTIAYKIAGGASIKSLREALESQDSSSEKLSDELALDGIMGMLADVRKNVENEMKPGDKRDGYKTLIVQGLWAQAERWIRQHGLSYSYDAVNAVRNTMEAAYKAEESEGFGKREKALKAQEEQLQKLYEAAVKIDLKEKTFGSNKGDIQAYVSALSAYVDEAIKVAIDKWAHDLKKDFCMDDKNDELSKLKKHIATFKDKAAEMNREAGKLFNKLASDLGMASLDVTTVYLPQLTKICNGNGWIKNNLFSRLYCTIFNLKDTDPRREDIMDFLNKNIYDEPKEQIKEEINKGEYIYVTKKMDEKTKKEVPTEDVRYFCNPNLDRSNEKIIDDFLSLAETVLNIRMGETKEIQEKWENKKISAFFADLTNDEKDEVRRSLSPALFFSYNNSRIEVTKKEEHMVFVAGSSDLAAEMLGFQKGNPKHRFEKAGDENTALVLKSKYGLALEDYRIYDSIKSVYDNATFREKYHFHHLFAQFGDKLSLDDLPIEVLPQHRSWAKMLILDKFKEDMDMFFYRDEEFDPKNYSNSMLEVDDPILMIAQPEAFRVHPATGKLILLREENERKLYKELEGKDFAEQFAMYSSLYYNYRFGETTDGLLQALLRQNRTIDGETVKGEVIFKKLYAEKHKAVLQELNEKRLKAVNNDEKRLYKVLFDIIRNDYDTVYKYIK